MIRQVTACELACEFADEQTGQCRTTFLVRTRDSSIVLALAADRGWRVDDEDGPDLCPRHRGSA